MPPEVTRSASKRSLSPMSTALIVSRVESFICAVLKSPGGLPSDRALPRAQPVKVRVSPRAP